MPMFHHTSSEWRASQSTTFATFLAPNEWCPTVQGGLRVRALNSIETRTYPDWGGWRTWRRRTAGCRRARWLRRRRRRRNDARARRWSAARSSYFWNFKKIPYSKTVFQESQFKKKALVIFAFKHLSSVGILADLTPNCLQRLLKTCKEKLGKKMDRCIFKRDATTAKNWKRKFYFDAI